MAGSWRYGNYRPFRLFNTQPRRSPTTAGTGVQDIAQTWRMDCLNASILLPLPPVSGGEGFISSSDPAGLSRAGITYLTVRPKAIQTTRPPYI